MKIFMGFVNISSLMHEYASGFRELGHEVFTVLKDKPLPIVDDDVDLCVAEMAQLKCRQEGDASRYAHWFKSFMDLAWQKALEADVCFFIWETFRPDCRDLEQLRAMGKIIIVRYCGSDTRDPVVAAQHAALHQKGYIPNVPDSLEHLRTSQTYLRMVERCAHLVLQTPSSALRPGYGAYTPLLDIDAIPTDSTQHPYPVILHAPSSRLTKGTAEWLQIFEALRSAGLQFGTRFVEQMPHRRILREYAASDIYCGSLYHGGKADQEALAGGCVVLSSKIAPVTQEWAHASITRRLRFMNLPDTDENHRRLWDLLEMDDRTRPDPYIRVRPETALEALASIILDLPRRKKLAVEGAAYARRWFDYKRWCKEILDIVQEPDKPEHLALLDVPDFFNLHFVPPDDPERLKLYNRGLDMVRRCPWYEHAVVHGERHGLRF